MTERLLQYIWQFQYFDRSQLVTDQGEPILIHHPGQWNQHQGPDFSGAQISIGQHRWVGSVELHILTSEWIDHGHSTDPHYQNVILHVVWEHNQPIPINVPVLELQHRIPKWLLQQYHDWMHAASFIPCANQWQQVSPLVINAWKDRMLMERWEEKYRKIMEQWKQSKGHWDELAWWLLARQMGGQVNADAFEQVAGSIPYSIWCRHRHQLIELEAMLLGQSGLLDLECKDAYPNELKTIYRHLKRKYQLQQPTVLISFLRMRPANFPTIRLVQLATLFKKQYRWMDHILAAQTLNEIVDPLTVTASAYWNDHFVFDVRSEHHPKQLGKGMRQQLVINVMLPLLFAHGTWLGNETLRSRALEWMAMMPPETNTITSGFVRHGWVNAHAGDSQAVLQLKKRYCDTRSCLSCAIGHQLLREFIPSDTPH